VPTEAQLRDTALRLRIRQRIENSLLPVMVPKQIHVDACQAVGKFPADCGLPDAVQCSTALAGQYGC
jgi:hypothetical protein